VTEIDTQRSKPIRQACPQPAEADIRLEFAVAGCARVPEAMSSCIRLVDLTSQVADKGIETDITGHHARQSLDIVERGSKIPRITAEGDKYLERVAIAGMARQVVF
jgi:hypothetical protein